MNQTNTNQPISKEQTPTATDSGYIIYFNVKSSGATGHSNVTFQDASGERRTYGANVDFDKIQITWWDPRTYPTGLVNSKDPENDGVTGEEPDPRELEKKHSLSVGISVTKEQYDRALKYSESKIGPTNYSLFTEACVDFVQDIYEQIGGKGGYGRLYGAGDRYKHNAPVWIRIPDAPFVTVNPLTGHTQFYQTDLETGKVTTDLRKAKSGNHLINGTAWYNQSADSSHLPTKEEQQYNKDLPEAAQHEIDLAKPPKEMLVVRHILEVMKDKDEGEKVRTLQKFLDLEPGIIRAGLPEIQRRLEADNTILTRLYNAISRGVKRGWNPDDPIGLDPETIEALGYNQVGPLPLLNRVLTVPAIATGDAVLRGTNALLHGGAALAGEGAQELGASQGTGRRLERDLLSLAQMSSGSVGRLGGTAASGKATVEQSTRAARHGVEIGRNPHKAWHTGRLARELRKEEPETTKFGKINRQLLDEINEIRFKEKEPPIEERDIRVYSAVLMKFKEKRIELDGMTPKQIAQSIYNVVHGKVVSVEKGNHSTAQRLINEKSRPADVGFVGLDPHKGGVSVKSIYRVDEKRLKKLREK